MQDSLKDLRNELRKRKKRITLVDRREDADIVVEITDRGTQNTGGGTAVNVGLSVTPIIPGQERVVVAMVTAGEFRSELKGAAPAYTTAAGALAKQIEDFVKVNHSKLIADRARRREDR